MTDTSEPNKAAGKKRGGMAGLIVGIVLAIVGGAGGFFCGQQGHAALRRGRDRTRRTRT